MIAFERIILTLTIYPRKQEKKQAFVSQICIILLDFSLIFAFCEILEILFPFLGHYLNETISEV